MKEAFRRVQGEKSARPKEMNEWKRSRIFSLWMRKKKYFPVSAENEECCTAAVVVLLEQIERRRRATCMLAYKWIQWELSLLENENEYKFFHTQQRDFWESLAAAATRLECIKKAWS